MNGPPPVKQRHGCLTTWLVLIIIFNALGAVGSAAAMKMDPAEAGPMAEALKSAPKWAFGVSAIFMTLNVVFAFCLFQWKKWAFWGYCVTAVASAIMSVQTGNAMSGLL